MSKPVLTGQQIGLLGGPLYTTYKVLGAIHYSDTIGGTPVYWLETNDADFNEINAIHFLDKENCLKTLTWDIDSKGFSCGYIEVDKALRSLFDTFFSSIKQTVHTDALRTMVLSCYTEGINLGDAALTFARKLFGWSAIRVFDPSGDDFLDAVRSILEAEAVFTETGSQCNLFCIDGKKREAVFKKKDGFSFRDGREIDLDDFKLTPNVNTRSVCQDAYFKTHTYIAGPGEVKYLAGLDPVYIRHSIKKPEIKKRMSVELIEPRTNRLLKQCVLSISDVLSSPKDILVKKMVEREAGCDYNELRRTALEQTDDYIQKLGSLGLETSELHTMLADKIKTITGKKRSLEKTKLGNLLIKTKELSDRLLPFGRKQERIFTILYFMNQYGGIDFMRWLYDHYNINNQILEIQYD
ncbi:MAG: bacillithiol biosynthesis BshC [Spirochaetales bacterium]|nr:bacillithiol biosynthesis BshC [Spirochaetales bacterium]